MDIDSALRGGGQLGLLLQASFFAPQPNATSDKVAVLNSTANIGSSIQLPYAAPNGSIVHLGDQPYGYPYMLFPNLTAVDPQYPGRVPVSGSNRSALLLGPVAINSSFGLMSMTIPIINNTSESESIGYLTVVMSARLITESLSSSVGLDKTGEALLIAPDTPANIYPDGIEFDSPGGAMPGADDFNVRYAVQPAHNTSRATRHGDRDTVGQNSPFAMKLYPAVISCITQDNSNVSNADARLATTNEQGQDVSVGFARVSSKLVDWCLLVEVSEAEAMAPIIKLRNILLACVFGTAGGIMLLVIPMAHFAVRPIRRLREATKSTVEHQSDSNPSKEDLTATIQEKEMGSFTHDLEHQDRARKRGLTTYLPFLRGYIARPIKLRSPDARVFKIPGKVPERKYWIKDELTDLTSTFNEMSDELFRQYTSLEGRVRERTKELEKSKQEAEVANESKTLFIANISHELKTPLNGILGMCAVCMGETDISRIQRSLSIIFKSGDLLLKLLNDLLTFSKNQFGHQLTLDEREFRMADLKVQLLTIFLQQVQENKIDYRVDFCGPESIVTTSDKKLPAYYTDQAFGPQGTGKIKDMCLRGDQHRISQIMINLVSNALKFTPEGGTVHVLIRCRGWAPDEKKERRSEERGRRTPSGSRNASLFNLRMPGRSHAVDAAANPAPVSPARSGANTPQPPLALTQTSSRDKDSRNVVSPSGSDTRPEPNRKLLFELSVEDTGPGIPLEMQQNVFKPFVQGDLGLSKKFGGTGLGLSICTQLCALMKGSISLKSIEGAGSTFVVTVPLQYVSERAESVTDTTLGINSRRNSLAAMDIPKDKVFDPRSLTIDDIVPRDILGPSQPVTTPNLNPGNPPTTRLVGLSQPFFSNKPMPDSPPVNNELIGGLSGTPLPGGKIRILVAEDNKVNQEVVLRMLKLEDIFDVTLAKDGQEAYDLVKESIEKGCQYNLILMDVQMPIKDGIESTKMIRQIGFKSPIVALTAFSEESNKKDCLDSGMDYFLAKPIRRPALKLVLRTYCATISEESSVDVQDPKFHSLPNSPSTVNKPRPRRNMKKRRDPSIVSASDSKQSEASMASVFPIPSPAHSPNSAQSSLAKVE